MSDDRERPRLWRFARSRAVTVLLTLALVPVVAFALMRAIPYDAVTPITQLVAYTPWVAGPALVVAAVCALARRWRLTAVAGVCALAFAVWLAPFYAGYVPGAKAQDGAVGQFTVLSTNAQYGWADAAVIVDLVRERDVDVLIVLELTTALRERLAAEGLDEILPHHVEAKVGADPAGSGIWAAAELTDVDTADRSMFAMPSATVDTAYGSVRVTAVHPLAPMPGSERTWAAEIAAVGEQMGESNADHEVFAGDFNATYDHSSFRALLRDGFVDATVSIGRGLNPSWSWGGGGLFPVDLDHIVTNAAVVKVQSTAVPGSDHRAVLAELFLGSA